MRFATFKKESVKRIANAGTSDILCLRSRDVRVYPNHILLFPGDRRPHAGADGLPVAQQETIHLG